MNEKYLPDQEIKELICEIGKRAYQKSFVAGTDGNISIKCENNAIWSTPTGVSKGYMTPEMMVKLDLDGNVIEKGELGPSSEVMMHIRVYKENPDVRSVVHSHAPVATAYAVAGKSLDRALTAENIVFLGNIYCAEYATPGTMQVPDSITPYCKDYNGVLLGNHGTLTWGDSNMEAYYRLESLEQSCKIDMIVNNILNEVKPLTKKQVDELMKIRKKAGIKRGGYPKIAEE